MDSHQFFGYSTSVGLSYTTSYPSVPSIPSRLFGSLKAEIGDSPNSPFVTHFDSDTVTNLSDGQVEQRCSTDNLSGSSHCDSSLDTSNYSYSQRLSPSVHSSYLQDPNIKNIKNVLYRLENALMGPDVDDEDTKPKTNTNLSFGESSKPWIQEQRRVIQPQPSVAARYRLSGEGNRNEKRQRATEDTYVHGSPPGGLKQLLIACAKALSENNTEEFDKLIEKARGAVSISGDPIQRLGAYMVEGLVARKEASGNNIYRALKCREPESKELLSYMHILYEICPYLKFGYMAANGAIANACRNKDRIHIVDFQIAQGTQWLTLLQALAARPGGPPHVRITGIDDPVNKYARGDGLDAVGKRLALISEKFNIPVEFHGVPVFAPRVTPEMLDVRPGEALAVNFPLQLHHTPDESVDVNNPRDGLLRMVKSLSPDVVTLVEQESNTNTTPFFTRFVETLEYYQAMFESIDVALPRESRERVSVEQQCLARDIVNVIACEGEERVERHELLGKWRSRLTMAGFVQYPLSGYVNSVIRNLLRYYSDHYSLVEKDGAMLLAWKGRNLISASAWQ